MGNQVANTNNNNNTTNNSCNSNGTTGINNSSSSNSSSTNNNNSNNNSINNSNSASNNASNGSANNQPPTPTSSNQSTTGSTMNEEHKLALKQWHYCIQLAKYMFEEGLLDRQELLQWILELLDKIRSSSEDGILKLLLPLALQYLEEFIQSELLARRLAYLCCRKLAHMCNNVENNNNPQSPSVTKNEVNGSKDTTVAVQGPLNLLIVAFNDYLTCAHHRDVIYSLATIIQVKNRLFYTVNLV